MGSVIDIETPEIDLFKKGFAALFDNIQLFIQGKEAVAKLALTCLFAEGHLLIEDVPGVGKTSLSRCIAASLEVSCQRIQFTPDLLPSDVTGVSIFNQRTNDFEFHPGPVFTNVVVADELNRASPKTQSALLEVMAERQVTVDGNPRRIPPPFMVIATQNPVDFESTYALPQAQLDRFMLRIGMGYPGPAAELRILRQHRQSASPEAARPVMSTDEFIELVEIARRIHVSDDVANYLVGVVAATRKIPELQLGGSPRATIALMRCAQVRAAADGRGYVTPEDVKSLAVPTLAHRLVLSANAESQNLTDADVVRSVLDGVPAPKPRPRLTT